MNFKKFFIISLSLIMVLSLAACGKDKKEPPVDINTPIIEEQQEPVDITPEEPEPEEPEPIVATVGSLVRLNNDDVALLIVGTNFTDATTERKYDYISVAYPQGLQEKNTYYGFNYEDIGEVLDINNVALRDDLDFEGTTYTGIKVSTDLNTQAIEALTKEASKYSVYQKNTTETGITIGVTGIQYTPGQTEDTLIFGFIIENNSESEIIANGRLDIVLSDGSSSSIDCDDSLINADDIINFRISPKDSKEGKIAFKIPTGTAENYSLTYSSSYVPSTTWYLKETNLVK